MADRGNYMVWQRQKKKVSSLLPPRQFITFMTNDDRKREACNVHAKDSALPACLGKERERKVSSGVFVDYR
jgi:hypothetical protein